MNDSHVWYAVAFVIFILGVAKLAGRNVLNSLDMRGKRIADELEQAEKLREDAQAALAQFQRKQRDALKEAEAIVAQAREEAARLRMQAAADLAATLKRHEQQAVAKIAQAEALALQQVRDMAVEIAVQATEKLLVQNVDDVRNNALVDAAIGELPAKLH